ncbi:MAG: hypothetical protein H6734_14935 [Alphaproteobacteria bacterium]|nr:hypothetical protein [Alphaproteobacteria bacterium]
MTPLGERWRQAHARFLEDPGTWARHVPWARQSLVLPVSTRWDHVFAVDAQGAVWVLGAAVAQEPPIGPEQGPSVEAVDPVLEEARATIEVLREQLAAAERATGEQTADAERTRLMLRDLSLLLDERIGAEERLAASRRLSERGDPGALPLLRAAALSRWAPIQVAAVATAGALGDLETPTEVLRDPRLSMDARREAIAALGRMEGPEPGNRLWDVASDPEMPRDLRQSALEVLEQRHPDVLAQRGRPVVVKSDGLWAGVLANGAAGGVMLSSIGTWGRSDEAAAIGGVGGAAVGIGTALLYGRNHSVSNGQGLRYASDVAWSLGAAGAASTLTVGAAPDLGSRSRENLDALYRLVGVGAGAAVGLSRLGRERDAVEVLESDLAGMVGMGLGMSISDLAWPHGDQLGNARACRAWSLDVPKPKACRYLDYRTASLAGAGVVGAAAGLAIHAATRELWTVHPQDLVFAGTLGVEAGWIGGWLPVVFDVEAPVSVATTGITAGFATGLATAYIQPVPLRVSAGIGWGTVLGNAGGMGIASLLTEADSPRVASMLATGVLGSVAGGFVGSRVDLTAGDVVMLGIFVPAVSIEGAAIASWLDQKGYASNTQAVGMGLTVFSAAGVGLTALAGGIDPDPGDAVFLGTAAAWGAWYGVLTPLALKLPGDPEDALLTSSLSADAFLLAGGLALRPLGVEPGHTVVAQLAGVGGATTGALVGAMASPEPETVAAGAVIGSTVGLVGGAVVSHVVRRRGGAQASLRMPQLRIPGRWSATVLPTFDGDPGMVAGISATGL